MKNAHLRRYPHSSSLRPTLLYASLFGISDALHLAVFDQPEQQVFFSNLIGRRGSLSTQNDLVKNGEFQREVSK